MNDSLREANKKVSRVESRDTRYRVKHGPAVFLSTGGMVNNGPVNAYIESLWRDDSSTIIITGYQAEGTKGRKLLETGLIKIGGQDEQAMFKAKKLDFSSHADMPELQAIIKKVEPGVVIAQHGDEFGVGAVVEYARSQNIAACAPATGGSISF